MNTLPSHRLEIKFYESYTIRKNEGLKLYREAGWAWIRKKETFVVWLDYGRVSPSWALCEIQEM